MISERLFARSFDSFWHELVPLLTSHFVAGFNETCGIPMLNGNGEVLQPLCMGEGVERPDLVAEFAFRLARSVFGSGLDCTELREEADKILLAEREAFELIKRYEGEKPSQVIPLSEAERAEGLLLCGRYEGLYNVFEGVEVVDFCPKFKGSGFLNASEGDVGIGDTLIEVKTTSRRPAGKDLRQLLVYLALDANAGVSRWRNIGLFNPRRGSLHIVGVDLLVVKVSGGRSPSDVFAELIDFTQSNSPVLDHGF